MNVQAIDTAQLTSVGTWTVSECVSNYPQTSPLNINDRVDISSEILWGSYLKIIFRLFTRNKPAVIWICFRQCEDLLELRVGFFNGQIIQ